jgi:hypothetical protein
VNSVKDELEERFAKVNEESNAALDRNKVYIKYGYELNFKICTKYKV